MARILFLPVFLFFTTFLTAQTVPDESVRWQINTDGNRITLRYKVLGVKPKKPYLGVWVEARSEEGRKPILYAQGDLGLGVDGDEATEKSIRFDPVENQLEDLGNLRFAFKVVSFPARFANGGGERLMSPLRQLPMLGGMLLGAGSVILALPQFAEARDLYDVYSTELNPYNPVYGELSRGDHLDDANRKYRNAQILTIGGGAVLLASTVFWINYRIKKSAWNRLERVSLHSGPGGLGLSVPLQKR